MLLAFLAVFFVSFLSTFFLVSKLIPRIKKRGLTGKDMNKLKKPEIAELGGIAITAGFSLSIMLALFIHSYSDVFSLNLSVLLAAFSTVLLIAFIGLVDDLLGWKHGIKQWQHALMPLFAALPLMAINIGSSPFWLPFIGFLPARIAIPFIGSVSFGVFYSLVLVPLGITGASNAANMLAGLNGLEAGLLALITGTLAIASFLTGKIEALILALALTGSFLAFLKFNWFPAKIFGGDSLTLMGGAGIASIAIIGNLQRLGVFLILLYFFELALKARSRFKAESFGMPQKNGILKAPKQIGSLTHLVMRFGQFTEKQVVLILLGLQAIVCLIGFSLFWFRVF